MKWLRTSIVVLAVVAIALPLAAEQPPVNARPGLGNVEGQARDQMQAPRTGTASISGMIVTDETTPQPVKRANVLVVNAEAGLTRNTFTNDAGRFSLAGLPAGRYTLSASKPPFLRASYGARRYDRPGTPITLAEGAQINGINLRMTRGSVLSGMITDENGQPAFGVAVRVMQMRMVNGERTFTNVPAGNSMGETTDDRGMYRFYGLPPGEYAVSATPRLATGEVRAMTDTEIRAILQALQQQSAPAQPGRPVTGAPNAGMPAQTPKPDAETVTVGYAQVYYPGTTVATSASTVTVGPGEERTGVDFALKLVRTARIEGTVATPSGIRPQSVQLLLTPAGGGQGSPGMELFTINRAAPDAEGKFAFTSVPPGQYTIVARASAQAPGAPPPPPPPPPPGGGGGMIQFQSVRVAPPGGAAETVVLPAIGLGDAGGPMFWGQTDISVDGTPLTGITVSLQPGMTITGRVAFKGTRLVPDPDLSRVQLILTTVAAQGGGGARIATSIPQGKVEPTGEFKITGVTPGRYRVSGIAPLSPGAAPGTGWTLASAIIKGRDVLDFPLEVGPNDEITDAVVTFTDATQQVTGSLQDATGRPAPDYTIIVFVDDSRFWTAPSRRIRSARPGTDGGFTVTNLPPGEYRIAAVTDLAPGEINDPAFLEQLVGGSVKFTLAEGERKRQDLRIAGGL